MGNPSHVMSYITLKVKRVTPQQISLELNFLAHYFCNRRLIFLVGDLTLIDGELFWWSGVIVQYEEHIGKQT